MYLWVYKTISILNLLPSFISYIHFFLTGHSRVAQKMGDNSETKSGTFQDLSFDFQRRNLHINVANELNNIINHNM